jgi:Macrocin-O-methyltransferase (TylF)
MMMPIKPCTSEESSVSVTIETTRDLYLTLLTRALLGLTIQDASNLYPEVMGKPSAVAPFDPARRAAGADWPTLAQSMIGEARMDNIRRCVEQILKEGVGGDLIETGVWRGGAVIFMRGLLKAYGVTDRQVWAADSFKGLPPPDEANYPQDQGLDVHLYPELAISLDAVKDNFERYGLLDSQVRFLEGWFRDTLPAAPIERLALMRLDGDLYESTMDALSNLYGKLSVGGFVIIDDFNVAACRAAVHDFRTAHGIADPIQEIDWAGVYWRRAS